MVQQYCIVFTIGLPEKTGSPIYLCNSVMTNVDLWNMRI